MENFVESRENDEFVPYCPVCSRLCIDEDGCDNQCLQEALKRLYQKEQEDKEFIRRYKISPIQAAAWKFDKIREY